MWRTAFAAIRVYAINGRRWEMAAVVMVLGLVPVVQNMVRHTLIQVLFTLTHVAAHCVFHVRSVYTRFRLHYVEPRVNYDHY